MVNKRRCNDFICLIVFVDHSTFRILLRSYSKN